MFYILYIIDKHIGMTYVKKKTVFMLEQYISSVIIRSTFP